jgi:hypothetical protein
MLTRDMSSCPWSLSLTCNGLLPFVTGLLQPHPAFLPAYKIVLTVRQIPTSLCRHGANSWQGQVVTTFAHSLCRYANYRVYLPNQTCGLKKLVYLHQHQVHKIVDIYNLRGHSGTGSQRCVEIQWIYVAWNGIRLQLSPHNIQAKSQHLRGTFQIIADLAGAISWDLHLPKLNS